MIQNDLKKRGISLIELVITAVILVILAGSASLRFIHSFDHTKLEQASARFIADFRLVQDQARRLQQSCTFTIDKANRIYQAPGVPGLYSPDDISVNLGESPFNITDLTTIPADLNTIAFDPRGYPDAPSAITLKRGDMKITIKISKNGQIEQGT